MDQYDLIVIGTGGAAMAAGIEVRSRAASVLLVEHNALGGTCLNIGCVPSKNLLAAADQRREQNPPVDWSRIRRHDLQYILCRFRQG